MTVQFLPLRRQLILRKLPIRKYQYVEGIKSSSTKDCSMKAVDRVCKDLNCHPQDVICTLQYRKLPKKRDYTPLYEMLKERKIILVDLVKMIHYYPYMRCGKHASFEKSRCDFRIYYIAYLLDVDPTDIVKEPE